MSLKIAVAVPFKQRGKTRLGEGSFVVALSLDRNWFSPDQVQRLITIAASRGLLSQSGDKVIAEFDPATISIPDSYEPDESILREQSAFEQLLDALVTAGHEKRKVVAEINERQRHLGISVEAAAAVYAIEAGVDLDTDTGSAIDAAYESVCNQ
ncbi:DUF2240 family protein [Haloquadratum walsbyi]|jgi:Uncharacterized protein conserved in archaea|uniref:Uncharacterized protein conserved in archaea n=1 Tax=Haloquadratum walsbyi J07HQW2 TaxID=1238425 RepID=U1PT25_9EURY|nr:DUF2240 family protein [Haloquadratum walsbyi]ERG95521.1 MAG: uncharacterized protein conserved in archaea [Haloquadratum walsbyi J07HQW2]